MEGRDCYNCRYLAEDSTGPHCRHCSHIAADHWEPAEKNKEKKDGNKN